VSNDDGISSFQCYCIFGRFHISKIAQQPGFSYLIEEIRRSTSTSIKVDQKLRNFNQCSPKFWRTDLTEDTEGISVSGYPDRRRDGSRWTVLLMVLRPERQMLFIYNQGVISSTQRSWNQFVTECRIQGAYGYGFMAESISAAFFYASGTAYSKLSDGIVTRGPDYRA